MSKESRQGPSPERGWGRKIPFAEGEGQLASKIVLVKTRIALECSSSSKFEGTERMFPPEHPKWAGPFKGPALFPSIKYHQLSDKTRVCQGSLFLFATLCQAWSARAMPMTP